MRAKTFINAAKRIESGSETYSCHAVRRESKSYPSPQQKLYGWAMLDDCYRPDKIEKPFRYNKSKSKNLRVWLLLMMAACHRDMERAYREQSPWEL